MKENSDSEVDLRRPTRIANRLLLVAFMISSCAASMAQSLIYTGQQMLSGETAKSNVPEKARRTTVTATSAADTVTVSVPVVAVSISPTSASVLANGTQHFTATVTGSSDRAVTWSATGGSVSSSGLYTAPDTAGSYTVTAISAADTTKSASATITVSAPVQHTVTLTWAASTSSVSGYNVYRGTVSGEPYAKINTALEAATHYVDNTVQSGTTYFYVVTSVDSSGVESAFSSPVTVVVPGRTPQCTATVTGCNTGSSPSPPVVGISGPVSAATPVDVFIPMNTGSAGNTISAATMAAGTIPSGSSWIEPYTTGAMSLAAHRNSLPGPISVGGTTYSPSTSSQSIAYNNVVTHDTLQIAIPTGHQKITVAGFVTIGPVGGSSNNNQLYDYWVIGGTSGINYATMSIDIGLGSLGELDINSETHPGSTEHSAPIQVVSGNTYWANLHVDFVAGQSTVALYNPTTLALVGQVTGVMTASGEDAVDLQIGNQEYGQQSGQTTYFENILIDYTNAVFPLVPTGWAATEGSVPLTGGRGSAEE